ncbi:MAG: hypothetical protein A3A43_03570 [Candidatus Liptonbacteria bacterium RIFCSPLOWO2_01_FULL_56_20]|uniref:Uncharacterized protein n=1 Tax=Candidatus Liptonbacteria bacterium RIFCSPLOWO2_01_FULL_56_20 TaxID=1798652 RepID=A0A1G2CIX8_9BACT|nr:MAG: hypothetical protein UY96_C0023G0011 [Parcubacteria group bacterium GW2011_GWB1_56_8]OGY97842.1 MAG: hypothetical protein A2681_02475 [Candidatus Liptonbacteria bacterium RIFCSPHIGHO2_01_FULL_56_18b]OGZ01335.1 MAG: hypothetical protein A3A43_03570 [Candidatus Liptonbacteria bacterium RIFCSPLOWO2_01_FULL_56_20]
MATEAGLSKKEEALHHLMQSIAPAVRREALLAVARGPYFARGWMNFWGYQNPLLVAATGATGKQWSARQVSQAIAQGLIAEQVGAALGLSREAVERAAELWKRMNQRDQEEFCRRIGHYVQMIPQAATDTTAGTIA